MSPTHPVVAGPALVGSVGCRVDATVAAWRDGDPATLDWSRLLLDAHEEGYAAVGPAIDASRGEKSRFGPWSPGGGRNPRFDEPLLLPSLLDGLVAQSHKGLPSFSGPDSLFEGRAVVRLRRRSGRPSG